MNVTLSSFVITTAAAVSSVMAVFVSLLFLLKDRLHSKYDIERSRAELSAYRTELEQKILEINQRLVATSERWKDVNHLLISSQRFQPEKVPSSQVYLSTFLRAAGLSQADLEVDPKLVFVLTSFHEEAQHTYSVIKSICESAGLRCARGDEANVPGDIFPHILKSIVSARIIIANIEGRNANVYYELGIAHALDKIVILVARSLEEIPFDVQTKRILLYKDEMQLGVELLTTMLNLASDVSSSPPMR